MKWYLAKLVYQIICGNGEHTPQFDEQLRLIEAGDETEALEKAIRIGYAEETFFFNNKQELVQWKFVDVSERYLLQQLIDGAEMYSRITETDDAAAYIEQVHLRAASLKEKTTQQLLHLI